MYTLTNNVESNKSQYVTEDAPSKNVILKCIDSTHHVYQGPSQ
jgi:hypothetical protein